MADLALAPSTKERFKQYEFYVFSVIGFALKSYLLVRLPYRPWYVNTALTLPLLLLIYCFFRFRQNIDRKSTRLNSSHSQTSYAVFCLKKKITIAFALLQLFDNGTHFDEIAD